MLHLRIVKDIVLRHLIKDFIKQGGRIDKFYLRDANITRRSLVYLNGWFAGDNVRAAIMKAFAK